MKKKQSTMTRVRPQKMCKKHPTIPAVPGKDLCPSCLSFKRFGESVAGAAKK